MLYLPDALLVGTFLDILMCAVIGGKWLITVRGVRIENTNIENGLFMPASTKPTCCDIQPGTAISDSRSTRKGLASDVLEVWLCAYIMTNLCHQVSSEVPHLVVPKCRESSLGAEKGVLYREGSTTCTINRNVEGRPAISERKSVPECTVVK